MADTETFQFNAFTYNISKHILSSLFYLFSNGSASHLKSVFKRHNCYNMFEKKCNKCFY